MLRIIYLIASLSVLSQSVHAQTPSCDSMNSQSSWGNGWETNCGAAIQMGPFQCYEGTSTTRRDRYGWWWPTSDGSPNNSKPEGVISASNCGGGDGNGNSFAIGYSDLYCADGYYMDGGTCTAEPTCPTGQEFNPTTQQCEAIPPNCSEKAGQTANEPFSRVSYDSEGCVYECENVIYLNSYDGSGGNSYECHYTGDEYTGDPGEEPPENTEDYCAVRSDQGQCLDASDPENQNDDGGCKHGTQFGYFGEGENMEPICAPTDGGPQYDPNERDTDDDGIPDSQDEDIDGDGEPNSSDVDEDGDGKNDKADTDGDGVPDRNDADIDGDGIPNGSDSDIDGDGIPNADDPTPNGDDSTIDDIGGEGEGIATDCTKKPRSSGDNQLAAIHMQLWLNECQGRETVGEGKEGQILGEVDAAGLAAVDGYGQIYTDALDADLQSNGFTDINEVGNYQGFLENLIPTGGNCSGAGLVIEVGPVTMPLECSKIENFKIVFGWFLAVITAYGIFMVMISPVESKV